MPIKNIRILIFLFLPVLVFIVLLLLNEKNATIFPQKSSNRIKINAFSDSIYTMNGSSGSLLAMSDTAVQFEYSAASDFSLAVKPVSGIEFNFENDTFNAAHTDYLDIDIAMKNASSFSVTIVTGERLTDTAHFPERRYSELTTPLQSHTGTYRLDLTKFTTPYWWKRTVSYTRNLALPKMDYSKIVAIRIQNNRDIPLLNPAQITVRKIEFRKDRHIIVNIGCISSLILVLAGSTIVLYRHRMKQKKYTPPQSIPHPDPRIIESGEVQKKRLVETQKKQLIDYINANYHRPELTVETVAADTHVRIDFIPKYLVEIDGKTFKPYLNSIRITEAKRLLETTDENITQIAFTVGYENIPNFNRVFKDIVGRNPTQYREERKKADTSAEKT